MVATRAAFGLLGLLKLSVVGGRATVPPPALEKG
jgi:hypothetical protein